MPPWMLALSLAAGDTVRRPVDDPWLGADKVKHGIVAFAIEGGAYASLRTVADHRASLVGATVAAVGISLLKERLDRTRSGFSVRDLAWDAAGIVLASVLVSHAPQR